MRTIKNDEMIHVSGGLSGTATGTVSCTTSTTTLANGDVTKSTTCVATTTIKVE